MSKNCKLDTVFYLSWLKRVEFRWIQRSFLFHTSLIPPLYPTGVLPRPSSGVHVFVRDEKRYAVLFQSVVLPCQYNSVSTQTPVVQWVYKSYCRDRTRDSFSHADVLSSSLGGGGGLTGGTGGAGGGHETRMMASYLDCADSSRTVRMVASISGSSVTLSEYYKKRDISIINSKNALAQTGTCKEGLRSY